MQSSAETIKDLLKDYRFYKMQAKIGLGELSLSERLEFIENAISALCEEDNKLMRQVYLEGLPVVKVAKDCCCVRRTVYYRCAKIVEKIAKVFETRFKT